MSCTSMSTFWFEPRSVRRITSSKVEHDVSSRTSPQNVEPPTLEPPTRRYRVGVVSAVSPAGGARTSRMETPEPIETYRYSSGGRGTST